ncbi:hypothetical protein EDD73_1275 [Heliophilum fasciatum]|uniref:Uncharacterized protein n=1 Tax=Heliophilum fasciatum TaxID=35700 RepID=A0A4R2RDH9_9FIRM|nr:hypothetical protein [Heliophilum fasciatum]TCP61502.1 hypothetical protein EDD73_1275 [Heliophilum fasciatum]
MRFFRFAHSIHRAFEYNKRTLQGVKGHRERMKPVVDLLMDFLMDSLTGGNVMGVGKKKRKRRLGSGGAKKGVVVFWMLP